jgi:hypothetical protein
MDVTLYYTDHFKGILCFKFVKVQTVAAQLTDSEGSSGTILTSPHHMNRKVLKNEYSEVTNEKY